MTHAKSSFPLLHWPSFLDKVRREVHLQDRAFFATVMAVAALASYVSISITSTAQVAEPNYAELEFEMVQPLLLRFNILTPSLCRQKL